MHALRFTTEISEEKKQCVRENREKNRGKKRGKKKRLEEEKGWLVEKNVGWVFFHIVVTKA